MSAEALDASETAVVTLTVTNEGIAPANEVVLRDSPVLPLAYEPDSTRLDGKAIADVDGGIPLRRAAPALGSTSRASTPD